MPKSRLFGYSVEEDDGKLLITLDGALAENCIRHIRDSAQAGRGGDILDQLLPMRSVYKLLSSGGGAQEEALSLEQLLGQNVDQSFASFEDQLADLKGRIAELNESETTEP